VAVLVVALVAASASAGSDEGESRNTLDRRSRRPSRRGGRGRPDASVRDKHSGCPAVDTTLGPVQGSKEEIEGITVYSFKGIPYAADTSGEKRWTAPVDPDPWSEPLDATSYGPICPQSTALAGSALTALTGLPPVTVANLPPEEPYIMSEDCLSINVYSGCLNESKPVMVWLHPGGLDSHSGNAFPPQGMVGQDTVLVTLNYRLGAFGYMAHPALTETNFGLRDQIKALQWVQDNIAAFGGDPSQVTIFGESSGGSSVMALLVSPASEGQFHSAIAESYAACLNSWNRTIVDGSAGGLILGQALGLNVTELGPERQLELMRESTTDQIMAAFVELIKNPIVKLFYNQLYIDGVTMQSDILNGFIGGINKKVPTLMGSNAYEGSAFWYPAFVAGQTFDPFLPVVPPELIQQYMSLLPIDTVEKYIEALGIVYGENAGRVFELYPATDDSEVVPQTIRLFTENFFTYFANTAADAMAKRGEDVHQYYFTQTPAGAASEILGAFHTAEIPYVYASNKPYNRDFLAPIANPELADTMNSYWTNFAKTGNPNEDGLPEWNPMTAESTVWNVLGPATGSEPVPDTQIEYFGIAAPVVQRMLNSPIPPLETLSPLTGDVWYPRGEA